MNIDCCINKYILNITFKAIVKLEAQREIARYSGNQFTPFKYIIQNERSISWIIADMLNPAGEHGQKDMFLRIFTKQVLKDAALDCSSVAVRCEASTHNINRTSRKIDILLTAPDWVCAIENKPRAAQQHDQLEDYSRHLASLKKAKTFLVFLAPHWITPQAFTTHAEGLRLWYFSKDEAKNQSPDDASAQVLFWNWTEECRKHCEADNVRRFITDFQHWVRTFIS